MRTYTSNGKAYLVTRDWLGDELHIPMNIITEAVVRAADEGFDAYRVETYIRDAMTLFKPTDTEATGVTPDEDTSPQNIEDGGPLELVINGEVYSFNIDRYETLNDLATWISETLNQVKEQIIEDHIAKLEADLEKTGFSGKNITFHIKM